MTPARPVIAVVLAAGGGTRMKSALPKVLHTVAGVPMLEHAICAARHADPTHLVVVVRHERDLLAEYLRERHPDVLIADQDEVPGTGRAVQCGLAAAAAMLGAGPGHDVLVTCADTPLLRGETLARLRARHARDEGVQATLLTAELANPTGYGRILRGETGAVLSIVEHRDATDAQRAIREVNTGVYVFSDVALLRALGKVGTGNTQGEMYLTDVVGEIRADGGQVAARVTPDARETEGVNDRVQLAAAEQEFNRRLLTAWMRDGVTVRDPASTWVDADVVLHPDVTLLPGVQLHGDTVIAPGATIGPDCTLTNVDVGAGAIVIRTHGSDAMIGDGAVVGPWSYLRPGTRLGSSGKIGAFTETKNAQIGAGSKVPHLSYVGDARIGISANIGCGTIFANYDGLAKHVTVIGDSAKIGSGTRLVPPVTVGDGAYTGAGAVIRRDVPPGALALSVAPQRNLTGWVQANRAGTDAAQAADAADRVAGTDT